MARLQLKAAPTFPVKVAIPVAGGASVPVVLTCKHRTRTELNAFIAACPGREDLDVFNDMVVGWDLEDPFTPESINELLENYIGTPLATYQAYIEELLKAKSGN